MIRRRVAALVGARSPGRPGQKAEGRRVAVRRGGAQRTGLLRGGLPGLALALGLAGTAGAWEEPRSGYEFLPPEVQQMQDDEFANPGMFAVEEGREAFNEPGFNGKACASCHGADGEKLDPQAIARYPIYDAEKDAPRTLQQQVNRCREYQLEELPLPYDDRRLVLLETFVRYKARGAKVNVDIDGPLRPFYEAGRALYRTRIGQLQMACTHCHDQYTGAHLRDQVLNQGQVNGFPAYRLMANRISSVQRKFRDCFVTLRARPYAPGSEAFINLELYTTARGNGLPIETPGIRR